MFRTIRPESCTRPVSYTHLDVYKRQDVDRIIVVGEGKIVADTTPDELLAANVLAEEGIREPLYITAVSYTHLGTDRAADR